MTIQTTLRRVRRGCSRIVGSMIASIHAQSERLARRLDDRTDAPPLHVPPGHFYSPIPSRADIDRHLAQPPIDPLAGLSGIDLRAEEQRALLEQLRPYYAELPFAEQPTPDRRYYYENPFYGYCDAIFLFALLRHLTPRRIVEIGSGYSTAVILDTAERFLGSDTTITCVDPYPGRLLSLLQATDRDRLELLPVGLQEVEPSLFAELQSGDVLFIDSTHVAKLGSDVLHLVFDILPMLASGVVVHVHDVFYPFDYPSEWIAENRAWNEAYFLRAFLAFNPTYEILLFNDFVLKRWREVIDRNFPLCLRNPGGSLWLRRI